MTDKLKIAQICRSGENSAKEQVVSQQDSHPIGPMKRSSSDGIEDDLDKPAAKRLEEEKEENQSTLSLDSGCSSKQKLTFPVARPHQTVEEIFRERLDIWKKDMT